MRWAHGEETLLRINANLLDDIALQEQLRVPIFTAFRRTVANLPYHYSGCCSPAASRRSALQPDADLDRCGLAAMLLAHDFAVRPPARRTALSAWC
jgi:hypothetical protein